MVAEAVAEEMVVVEAVAEAEAEAAVAAEAVVAVEAVEAEVAEEAVEARDKSLTLPIQSEITPTMNGGTFSLMSREPQFKTLENSNGLPRNRLTPLRGPLLQLVLK